MSEELSEGRKYIAEVLSAMPDYGQEMAGDGQEIAIGNGKAKCEKRLGQTKSAEEWQTCNKMTRWHGL